jgi:hypothetical protein
VISLDSTPVAPHTYLLRQSDDLIPFKATYRDEVGVDVEIIAGMAAPPPDDTDAETSVPEGEYYGWYVLCNDRAVVTADKSDLTVWGNDNFNVWHPQYNGFLGLVRFSASDTKLLPWTTTKRDVDKDSGVYRRALVKMKEATREWASYTNQRRNDLDHAKAVEARAVSVPVAATQNARGIYPTFARAAGPAHSAIQYSKPTSEVLKVKMALGGSTTTNKQVGIATFEYFLRNEVE